jgi:hypothetical protein
MLKKRNMKSLSKDIVFASICTCIIATASYALYYDFTRTVTHAEGSKIGTITYKKKIAERKYSEQAIWENVAQNAPVYNFDSIRTAAGSVATIKLQDGTEIILEENTLILLNQSEQGLAIDFSRGGIAANRETGSNAAFKINTANATVAIDRGNLNLSQTKRNELNVNVSTGSALISTESGEQAVTSNQIALVKKDSADVSDVPIIPLTPLASEYFITFAPRKNISFSWKSDIKENLLLELSRNQSFSVITESFKIKGSRQTTRIPLSIGTYFWRLKAQNNPEKKSPIHRFTILQEKPLTPVAPFPGQIFSFRNKYPTIVFKWTGNEQATSYNLSIARDKRMKQQVTQLKSEVTTISMTDLPEGVYYWNIRSNYGITTDSLPPASTVHTFTITRKEQLGQPQLLSPANKSSFSSLTIIQNKLFFSWSKNRDAQEFELQIAKDKNFKNIIHTITSTSNFHALTKILAKTTYYWRVITIAKDRARSLPSPYFSFSITDPKKIRLISPAEGTSFETTQSTQGIHFNWQDPNQGKRYYFELSTRKDFSSLVHSNNLTSHTITINKLEEGTYYWQVSLLDKNKKSIAQSTRASFTIAGSLPDPVALYPLNNNVIDMRKKSSITFKWKPVQGATMYTFYLFKTIAGINKQVFLTTLGKNSYNLTNLSLLDKGQFSWQVVAIKKQNRQPTKKSISKKLYFTITLGEKLQTPEITTPGIIYVP